jgi:hypothetical protein
MLTGSPSIRQDMGVQFQEMIFQQGGLDHIQ